MRGKMMLGAVLLLLLAGGAYAVWEINRIPVPVSCYIYDQCGGCSVTDHPCNACTGERQYRIRMENMLEEAGVRDQVDLKIYNVLYSFYRNNLTKAMEAASEPAEMTYPAVFAGSTMLLGQDEVESKLLSAIREEGTWQKKLGYLLGINKETHMGSREISRIVFFTMEGCPDCQEAKVWLDARNGELGGKLYEKFDFYPVGSEEPGSWEMLKKFYILHGREQESLWVPTIAVNDRCLIGMDEIRNYFEHYDTDEKIRTEVPKDYE